MKRYWGTIVFCWALAAGFAVAAWAGSPSPILVAQTGHRDFISQVALSPDGKIVASCDGGSAVNLWRIDSGRGVRTITDATDSIVTVAWNPDGKRLVTGGDAKTIKLWDATNGKLLREFKGHSEAIESVAFSRDGKKLLSGSDDKTIRVWDVATAKPLQAFNGHTEAVVSVAWGRDGKTVVSGSFDNTVKVWDAVQGGVLRTLKGHGGDVRAVAVSPDGTLVASGGEDKTIRLWDLKSGRQIRILKGHIDSVSALSFSADGKNLASGGADNRIRTWDVASGRELRAIKGHETYVTTVALSPDGKTIVSGGWDKTVKVWNFPDGELLRVLKGTASAVLKVAFDSDGKTLLCGSGNGRIRRWELQGDGKELRGVRDERGYARTFAFTPDGKKLACATGGLVDELQVWEAESGKKSPRFGESFNTQAIDLSPAGDLLASVTWGKDVDLWDVKSGRKLRALKGHATSLSDVAFSPGGKLLASCGGDKTIRLWDVATGAERKVLRGHTGDVWSLAFSPDGSKLISSSADGTIALWDVAGGKRLLSLRAQMGGIKTVTFSPDGKTLAAGGWDDRIKLWNAADGRLVRSLQQQTVGTSSLAYSPDGRILAAASWDAITTLWDVAAGRKIADLIALDNGNWVVRAPDGRFDTDNFDENTGLSWILPDEPFTPLPLEIFMRQYYEPRLLPRLLAGEKFKPLPDLQDLNRVLPRIAIHKPEPLPGNPDEVSVQVEVTRGQGEYLQNGKVIVKTSGDGQDRKTIGVHDVKLFRDGQLVGFADDKTIEAQFDEKTGRALLNFTHIRLPRAGAVKVEFSAYGFNADLVKSETSRQPYFFTLLPRKGKAYIITVGVNASQNPDLKLRYAVPDAQLTARVLKEKLEERNAKSKEYSEIVAIPLLADTDTDGKLNIVTATKANFADLLHLLAGEPVNAERLQELKTQIPDVERLEKATPEDLLIIAFACHGDLTSDGEFHLLPYDVGGSTPGGLPYANSISSEDLSRWLRYVDAGEMAMIVDACHSAGAVGGEFKPGPMGSRGLGQLAYDKGMRILAASQADNVALESASVQHGLLTFALVQEGIEAGQADGAPKDRKLLLEEWLNYGVARVPQLADDIRAGRSVGRGFKLIEPEKTATAKRDPAQQPSLFDFKKKRREVVLDQSR